VSAESHKITDEVDDFVECSDDDYDGTQGFPDLAIGRTNLLISYKLHVPPFDT